MIPGHMAMRLCQSVLPARCGPIINIGLFIGSLRDNSCNERCLSKSDRSCSHDNRNPAVCFDLQMIGTLKRMEPAGGIEHSICCKQCNYSSIELRRPNC